MTTPQPAPRLAQRASALGLALAATLAVLSGLDGLATKEHAGTALAAAQPAAAGATALRRPAAPRVASLTPLIARARSSSQAAWK